MTVFVVSLCLVALLSILYSTLRTGVPPMPSSWRSRRALLDCLAETVPGQPSVTLVDLGSGWGGVAIAMARRFPEHRVEGYEVSWLPWLFSRLLKALLRLNNLTLYRGDFNKAALREARYLVTYLNPHSMVRLRQRLDQPQAPIRTLFSIGFALPDAQSERVVRVNELFNTPIYQYRLGGKMQDTFGR